MNDLPQTWWSDALDGESWVLVGKSRGALHMVAPPGVRCRPAEPEEERLLWRHAVWINDDESDPPAARVDTPDAVTCMQTREVVEMLPIAQHDFVRQAMARQISRAVTFGLPIDGDCPDEQYARGAGGVLAWVTGQLSEAFPAETWFRPAIAPARIPDTAEELLRRLPGESSGSGRGRRSSRRWRLLRRRRWRGDGFFSWRSLAFVAVSARLHGAFGFAFGGGSKAAAPLGPASLEHRPVDDAQVH